MCGLLGLYMSFADLVEILGFELPMPKEMHSPRWNIETMADVLAIRDCFSRHGLRWADLNLFETRSRCGYRDFLIDERSQNHARRSVDLQSDDGDEPQLPYKSRLFIYERNPAQSI